MKVKKTLVEWMHIQAAAYEFQQIDSFYAVSAGSKIVAAIDAERRIAEKMVKEKTITQEAMNDTEIEIALEPITSSRIADTAKPRGNPAAANVLRIAGLLVD